MYTIARWCGIAAVLLSTFGNTVFAADSGGQQVPPRPTVHVRLVDMSGLPDKVETQVESMVAAMFRRAGLELDFIDAAGKADFWMQILKRRPLNRHGDTTGFAVLVRSPQSSDSYAAVSLPVVEESARELDAPLVEVLAASIAHELGHLVLHSSGHAQSGIMKARLDRGQIELLERGDLWFTKDEAARLAELARRLAR